MMKLSVAAETSPAINPDWTSSGKEHFEGLDGESGQVLRKSVHTLLKSSALAPQQS